LNEELTSRSRSFKRFIVPNPKMYPCFSSGGEAQKRITKSPLGKGTFPFFKGRGALLIGLAEYDIIDFELGVLKIAGAGFSGLQGKRS